MCVASVQPGGRASESFQGIESVQQAAASSTLGGTAALGASSEGGLTPAFSTGARRRQAVAPPTAQTTRPVPGSVGASQGVEANVDPEPTGVRLPVVTSRNEGFVDLIDESISGTLFGASRNALIQSSRAPVPGSQGAERGLGFDQFGLTNLLEPQETAEQQAVVDRLFAGAGLQTPTFDDNGNIIDSGAGPIVQFQDLDTSFREAIRLASDPGNLVLDPDTGERINVAPGGATDGPKAFEFLGFDPGSRAESIELRTRALLSDAGVGLRVGRGEDDARAQATEELGAAPSPLRVGPNIVNQPAIDTFNEGFSARVTELRGTQGGGFNSTFRELDRTFAPESADPLGARTGRPNANSNPFEATFEFDAEDPGARGDAAGTLVKQNLGLASVDAGSTYFQRLKSHYEGVAEQRLGTDASEVEIRDAMNRGVDEHLQRVAFDKWVNGEWTGTEYLAFTDKLREGQAARDLNISRLDRNIPVGNREREELQRRRDRERNEQGGQPIQPPVSINP